MSEPVAVLPGGLGLSCGICIVDVGADPLGEAPCAAVLGLGGCDVMGSEPKPIAFAELAGFGAGNETFMPFTVGDGSCTKCKTHRGFGWALRQAVPPGFVDVFSTNPRWS